jgi:nicotinamidase-related amidase
MNLKKSALIIIDVQNGMFLDTNPVYNGEMLIHNLKYLINKARLNITPICYIQHNASAGKPLEIWTKGWEIHPEITPQKGDIIIQKETPDSFFNTNLDEELKKQGINHVILTGIQSEVCVDTTCRRAFSMNYDVTLVADSHSTWDSNEITAQQIINHHTQVLRWFAQVKEANSIEF